jgi:hypothetical protein
MILPSFKTSQNPAIPDILEKIMSFSKISKNESQKSKIS